MSIAELQAPLYWRFSLKIKDNINAILRWGYLTPRSIYKPYSYQVQNKVNTVRIEIINNEGKILDKVEFPILIIHDTDTQRISVNGEIPFQLNAKYICFYYKEINIYKFQIPDNKPEIWITKEVIDENKLELAWDVKSKKEDNLWYSVLLQFNDQKTAPLYAKIKETRVNIDLDAIPGGDNCRIIIRASNDYWIDEVQTKPFTVSKKAPIANIIFPRHKQSLNNELIQARGSGWSIQAQAILPNDALAWYLDKTFLGRGNLIVFKKPKIGKHELVLLVTDEKNLLAEKNITFEVI